MVSTVGHRTWTVRAENVGMRACFNGYAAVHSTFRQGRRAGARKQTTVRDETFDADTSS